MNGFVRVEQIKSIDYRARRVRFIEKVPAPTLQEVLGILDAVVY